MAFSIPFKKLPPYAQEVEANGEKLIVVRLHELPKNKQGKKDAEFDEDPSLLGNLARGARDFLIAQPDFETWPADIEWQLTKNNLVGESDYDNKHYAYVVIRGDINAKEPEVVGAALRMYHPETGFILNSYGAVGEEFRNGNSSLYLDLVKTAHQNIEADVGAENIKGNALEVGDLGAPVEDGNRAPARLARYYADQTDALPILGTMLRWPNEEGEEVLKIKGGQFDSVPDESAMLMVRPNVFGEKTYTTAEDLKAFIDLSYDVGGYNWLSYYEGLTFIGLIQKEIDSGSSYSIELQKFLDHIAENELEKTHLNYTDIAKELNLNEDTLAILHSVAGQIASEKIIQDLKAQHAHNVKVLDLYAELEAGEIKKAEFFRRLAALNAELTDKFGYEFNYLTDPKLDVDYWAGATARFKPNDFINSNAPGNDLGGSGGANVQGGGSAPPSGGVTIGGGGSASAAPATGSGTALDENAVIAALPNLQIPNAPAFYAAVLQDNYTTATQLADGSVRFDVTATSQLTIGQQQVSVSNADDRTRMMAVQTALAFDLDVYNVKPQNNSPKSIQDFKFFAETLHAHGKTLDAETQQAYAQLTGQPLGATTASNPNAAVAPTDNTFATDPTDPSITFANPPPIDPAALSDADKTFLSARAAQAAGGFDFAGLAAQGAPPTLSPAGTNVTNPSMGSPHKMHSRDAATTVGGQLPVGAPVASPLATKGNSAATLQPMGGN